MLVVGAVAALLYTVLRVAVLVVAALVGVAAGPSGNAGLVDALASRALLLGWAGAALVGPPVVLLVVAEIHYLTLLLLLAVLLAVTAAGYGWAGWRSAARRRSAAETERTRLAHVVAESVFPLLGWTARILTRCTAGRCTWSRCGRSGPNTNPAPGSNCGPPGAKTRTCPRSPKRSRQRSATTPTGSASSTTGGAASCWSAAPPHRPVRCRTPRSGASVPLTVPS